MNINSLDNWAGRFDRLKDHFTVQTNRLNDKIHDISPLIIRTFAGPAEISAYLNQGIRIAHLTDQHVGRVTPLRIQLDAVRQTNAQKPDLVLLTGDFVCHSELYLQDLSYVISQFEAPVFAVLGNHDHWTSAAKVTAALKAGGAEVLNNANTVVSIKGERLQLIGLDDAYTGHANVTQATRGLKKDIATIGLSHIAEEAEKLWLHKVPLVLSGHTHGGQITVAGLNELLMKKIVKHKYIHGAYGELAGIEALGSVYVGAGIGSAILPLRLGHAGRREVALFDLKSPH